MKYIPTNLNMEQSWELSSQLWQQIAGNVDGTTKYLVAPMEHPETKFIYFYMDEGQAEQLGLDVENGIADWPVVEEFF